MEKLYSKLANVYHEMYQTKFNYKKEFIFLRKILDQHKCKSVIEMGCGTGMLASYFLKSGFSYQGLDLSKRMLAIAKKVAPKANFLVCDMRNIKINKKFDAAIISGRTFTYMRENKDIMKSIKSINKALKNKGLLIFDNFDANYIFNNFNKKMVFRTKFRKKIYKRISENEFNLKTGFTWNIKDTYFIKKNKKTRVEKDKTTLRAFAKDELKILLNINGFKVLKFIQSDFLKEPFSFFTIAQKI